MKTTISLVQGLLVLLALAALLVAAGCGGTTDTVNTKAGKFSGSAIADFGGPDGDDVDARQVARQLMVNRFYDFTETGYVLAAGGASSTASGNVSFGSGTGTVAINGSTATVDLFIQTLDPAYTGAELNGSYSVSAAQSAIDNAGNTFTVSWIMFYTTGGQDYEIHFSQVLTGSDFREV